MNFVSTYFTFPDYFMPTFFLIQNFLCILARCVLFFPCYDKNILATFLLMANIQANLNVCVTIQRLISV